MNPSLPLAGTNWDSYMRTFSLLFSAICCVRTFFPPQSTTVELKLWWIWDCCWHLQWISRIHFHINSVCARISYSCIINFHLSTAFGCSMEHNIAYERKRNESVENRSWILEFHLRACEFDMFSHTRIVNSANHKKSLKEIYHRMMREVARGVCASGMIRCFLMTTTHMEETTTTMCNLIKVESIKRKEGKSIKQQYRHAFILHRNRRATKAMECTYWSIEKRQAGKCNEAKEMIS